MSLPSRAGPAPAWALCSARLHVAVDFPAAGRGSARLLERDVEDDRLSRSHDGVAFVAVGEAAGDPDFRLASFGDADNAITVGMAALSIPESAGKTARQAAADAGEESTGNAFTAKIKSFIRENIADTIGDTTYVSVPALIILCALVLALILTFVIIHSVRRAMRLRRQREIRGGYRPAARNRARHTYSSSDYQRRQKRRRRDAYLRDDYDDYRDRDDDDNYY